MQTNPLLLLVEDDDSFARLVTRTLEKHGFKVIRLAEGLGAADVVLSEAPRLVLLDMMLPDATGIEVCEAIRAVSPVPVLMLTALDPSEHEAGVLEKGADGYVAKSIEDDILIARIKSTLRLAARLDNMAPGDRRIRIGPMTIDPFSRTVVVGESATSLSPAEFEVLEMLARRPNEVIDRAEMYREVWGIDYDGVDRALDQRISRLRSRLDPILRGAIRSVRGRGYRLAVEASAEG